MKMYTHTKACIRMFIAALFMIAKKWKQPKYPLGDEWINKIHAMEYYLTIRKNEVPIHATTWMKS